MQPPTLTLFISDRGVLQEGPCRHPEGPVPRQEGLQGWKAQEVDRQEAHPRREESESQSCQGRILGSNRRSKRIILINSLICFICLCHFSRLPINAFFGQYGVIASGSMQLKKFTSLAVVTSSMGLRRVIRGESYHFLVRVSVEVLYLFLVCTAQWPFNISKENFPLLFDVSAPARPAPVLQCNYIDNTLRSSRGCVTRPTFLGGYHGRGALTASSCHLAQLSTVWGNAQANERQWTSVASFSSFVWPPVLCYLLL